MQSLPAGDFALPAEYDPAGPGGVWNHLLSDADRGGWRLNLDGQVQTTLHGTAILYDALIYDNVNDEWTVNLDGANHTLLFFTDGFLDFYLNDPSSTTSVDFYTYDAYGDPATSQYGSYGILGYGHESGTSVFYTFHFGLKTPQTGIPTGSATYSGTFEGRVISLGEIFMDQLLGTATVDADFTSGDIAFASSGCGTSSGCPAANYDLTGTGTITGNTYQGTLSGGQYTNSTGVSFTVDTAGSSLSGAFYGPDQTGGGETAGVIYATDGSDSYALIGGFWALQTGYTP